MPLNNPAHLKNNLLFFKTFIEILPHSDKHPPVVSPQRSIPMQRQPILSDWSWLTFSGYDFSDYEIPFGIKYDPTDITLEMKSNAQPFDLFELEDVPF